MRLKLYKFVLTFAFVVTAAVYWPGLYGSFLFDDNPNIVDNHDVQPREVSLPSLMRAALSSPSSEFKRPLASLSFTANYLATGLDPYWMKLTNLIIHLLNGLLVFLLAWSLLKSVAATDTHATGELATTEDIRHGTADRTGVTAALIAASWLLLPINLTAVLYVVQRMESMANLFVLLGLIGYVTGRRRMLASTFAARTISPPLRRVWLGGSRLSLGTRGFVICVISITVPTVFGLLAKETAVMLPLYAMLVEWIVFRFRSPAARDLDDEQRASHRGLSMGQPKRARKSDLRVITLFLLVLILPMALGLAWLLPGLLKPETWSTRDFTLGTRLLSESRIIVDYVSWTLVPTPQALSFYHDDFRISTGLLAPWTTLASIASLIVLVALIPWLRLRRPLVALGIALFIGCQLLTGTVIPLELIYEHRNYFASFGLLLAVVPVLCAPRRLHPRAFSKADVAPQHFQDQCTVVAANTASIFVENSREARDTRDSLPLAFPRYALLGGLMLSWTALTALTAYEWGNPLRLAEDLASRAPLSPRAQYELGRTFIIISRYDPTSPFTKLAYEPLEKAATLPKSTILPLQALIFMNARMHLPLKDAWWDQLISKLDTHKPGVQDESSLEALTKCARARDCELPANRMTEAFLAALNHPNPSARLFAIYGDFAWNVLDDKALGERMTEESVRAAPNEPAYHVTLVRMLAAQGRKTEALQVLKELDSMNIAGRLNDTLTELRALPGLQ